MIDLINTPKNKSTPRLSVPQFKIHTSAKYFPGKHGTVKDVRNQVQKNSGVIKSLNIGNLHIWPGYA